MRLDAYCSYAGLGSRSTVKKPIRAGEVTVDGRVWRQPSARLPEGAEVRHRGGLLELPPRDLHVVLNKPVGHACSRDGREAPLIYELLPERWRPWLESAGRLDRGSSGLLICSTEGDFIHRLIHPARKLHKRYRVRYRGTLPRDAVRRCAEGLRLPDTHKEIVTRPALLELQADDEAGFGRATLTIHEGRYHQVRRMFRALRCQVHELHRDRIGGLDLPADLPPGRCRELRAEETTALFRDSGP